MEDARLATLRQAYADELAQITPITHAPLAAAFAAVPRERFVGPGPWRIFGAACRPARRRTTIRRTSTATSSSASMRPSD